MSDVEKILQTLLGDRRLRESATFSSRTYSDRPIIQTGRQLRERARKEAAERDGRAQGPRHMRGPSLSSLPHTDYTPDEPPAAQRPAPRQAGVFGEGQRLAQEKIPERYYQLRELAGNQPQPSSASWRGALAYGTRSANRLFYEQARLMEDFEDDYDFQGTYFQYFPTYSSMTLGQLRGYFSWRTKVRHGEMPEAPASFAFLHVYELLCGVGTTPGEQGFSDLVAFRDAYAKTQSAQGTSFASYLRRWLKDYVIYHGLDPALLGESVACSQGQLMTLLQAEDEQLRSQGLARKEGELGRVAAPTDERLLEALNEHSSYRICGARLYKSNPDEVRFVACQVFRALVVHCSRRRKTDFVEGLFGGSFTEFHTMFASAVFYEEQPHADAEVRISALETYRCKGGLWQRTATCQNVSRSADLGAILHEVDVRLRERLAYAYPLKSRPVAAYVTKFIDKAIDELLARQAEEERRRISIDLTRLAGIRAAAAVTQEALLTDEERDDAPVVPEGGQAASSPAVADPSPAAAQGNLDTLPLDFAAAGAPEPPAALEQGLSPSADLSQTELDVLCALLAGRAPEERPGNTLLSLVIDSINEKLFDMVGDAVIAFEGEEPALVEDYVEDVREIVGA